MTLSGDQSLINDCNDMTYDQLTERIERLESAIREMVGLLRNGVAYVRIDNEDAIDTAIEIGEGVL